MAHALLGISYRNLGETSLATESTRKAYELRERSEREKLTIESFYYQIVTGDIGKGASPMNSGRSAICVILCRRPTSAASTWFSGNTISAGRSPRGPPPRTG